MFTKTTTNLRKWVNDTGKKKTKNTVDSLSVSNEQGRCCDICHIIIHMCHIIMCHIIKNTVHSLSVSNEQTLYAYDDVTYVYDDVTS